MIAIGENALDFKLKDQFGRDVTLDQFNGQAPCLVVGNRAVHEAADIMRYFADRTTAISG